ncbi:MAG: hypothetical protein PWP23_2437 [Candidatus Sumerlaeota bacterium]|nr:hypothetical protein [Candidatus Sumerlaeota bacterium]
MPTVNRLLFLAFSACLILCTACSRSGLILDESSDSVTDVVVVGDVRVLMEGKAGPENFWSVAPGIYGMALGTVADRADPNRQGTGMVIGGTGYLRPVVGPAVEASSLLISDSVYSSFLAGIPANAAPTATYRIEGGFRGLPLEDVLAELRKEYDGSLFFVGQADFHVLMGTSLAASPGAGEALHGRNRPSAYRNSDQLERVPVLFAGVLLADDREPSGAERYVFFVDERDPRDGRVQSRIHGVVLSSLEGADWRHPVTIRKNAVLATEILPLSLLDTGTLEVFAVDGLDVRP